MSTFLCYGSKPSSPAQCVSSLPATIFCSVAKCNLEPTCSFNFHTSILPCTSPPPSLRLRVLLSFPVHVLPLSSCQVNLNPSHSFAFCISSLPSASPPPPSQVNVLLSTWHMSYPATTIFFLVPGQGTLSLTQSKPSLSTPILHPLPCKILPKQCPWILRQSIALCTSLPIMSQGPLLQPIA